MTIIIMVLIFDSSLGFIVIINRISIIFGIFWQCWYDVNGVYYFSHSPFIVITSSQADGRTGRLTESRVSRLSSPVQSIPVRLSHSSPAPPLQSTPLDRQSAVDISSLLLASSWSSHSFEVVCSSKVAGTVEKLSSVDRVCVCVCATNAESCGNSRFPKYCPVVSCSTCHLASFNSVVTFSCSE